MTAKDKAKKVFDIMFLSDHFSKWLGIELIDVDAGFVKLKMKVREEMQNGFGIIHGGVTYSFADSALAFASNSHGRLSVALDTAMSYPAPVNVGDELIATATEVSVSNRIGIYDISVENQDGKKVGVFKGTVYRTSKEHV